MLKNLPGSEALEILKQHSKVKQVAIDAREAWLTSS